MHKSRLGVVVLDCQTGSIEEHVQFWATALGREPEKDPVDDKYRDLVGPEGDIGVLLQAVDHMPRAHIDIETDDIPAEVARLKALGAREIGPCKRWVVMEAPSGHRFCVVNPQRPDFAENANKWP